MVSSQEIEAGVLAEETWAGDDWLPPGYRFIPSDQELIACYLKKKFANPNLLLPFVRDVGANFVNHTPLTLKEFCWMKRVKKAYFFIWGQVDRQVTDGYWEPSGPEVCIDNSDGVRVTLRSLVFVKSGGEATTWIIREYRLSNGDNSNGDNGLVLCALQDQRDEEV